MGQTKLIFFFLKSRFRIQVKFLHRTEKYRRFYSAIPRRVTSANTMNGMCTRTNIPNPCFRDVCFHQNYRTFDGSCNNLVNSLQVAINYCFYSYEAPIRNIFAGQIRRNLLCLGEFKRQMKCFLVRKIFIANNLRVLHTVPMFDCLIRHMTIMLMLQQV